MTFIFNYELYIVLIAIYITLGAAIKIVLGLNGNEKSTVYTIGDSLDGIIMFAILAAAILF